MRERPNRMVSKTIVAQVTVGSNPTPSALEHNRRAIVTATRAIGVAVACAVFLFVAASPAGARATTTAHESAANALGAGEAVVLGIVEGVTEFLPISSTGHLLITARLLDLPTEGKAGDAVKSYEIAIQFGAILAVLVLYWGRVREMFNGLIGRDEEGRRLVSVVAIAFVPAA